MSEEADIQTQIIEHFKKHPRVELWRNNTGVARTGGRFIRYGKVGSGDITGLMDDGTRVEIEVKKPGGTQSDDQIDFERRIIACGGVYILAESLKEAIEQMEMAFGKQIKREDFLMLFEHNWQCWINKNYETWWTSPRHPEHVSTAAALRQCRRDINKKNGIK